MTPLKSIVEIFFSKMKESTISDIIDSMMEEVVRRNGEFVDLKIHHLELDMHMLVVLYKPQEKEI